jgi:hypothetical protein
MSLQFDDQRSVSAGVAGGPVRKTNNLDFAAQQRVPLNYTSHDPRPCRRTNSVLGAAAELKHQSGTDVGTSLVRTF